jgi:sulfoxide reductase heme-binding subunit YedZ
MIALAAATPRAVWYLSRGAGIVTLVGLTVTVVLGIVDVRRVSAAGWPRFVLDALHRDVALASLLVLALHVVTAVIDSFAPIGVLDAFVPFGSHYRPLWLGLGALALDVLLAVTITSLLRRRLGYRAWRALHWTAYGCWPLALVHGLGTGTDVKDVWMLSLTLACVVAVLAAVAWRVTADAPRGRVPILGAVAAACLVLAGWVEQGPLAKGWARRAGTPATLAPATAVAAVPSALPRSFRATLSGTLAQRLSSNGARATVELALTLAGGASGALNVHLSGRPVSGGVTLDTSRVTLGPTQRPRLYSGRITALSGQRVEALVRGADGARRLDIELSIAGADVTGSLAAEPAA